MECFRGNFIFNKIKLDGVYVIEPKIFRDDHIHSYLLSESYEMNTFQLEF